MKRQSLSDLRGCNGRTRGLRVFRGAPAPGAGLLLAFGLALGVCGALGGCVLAPLLRSSELEGSHQVEAKYSGLTGKSFAVIVSVDRMTQADFPELVAQLTTTISERLAKNCDASGWVPPETVLSMQAGNPRWSVMRLDELCKELQVQRLVFVDVTEFRLVEPGNSYLWKAVAAGKVGVVEADGAITDNFTFQEQVRAIFPLDERALGPAQLPANIVQLKLAKKFIDRAAWLFYTHEEKNVETDSD
ncbi:MAG: hypothetical protein H7210_07855 [Pyrinomonadaceae bacterium]|nr:hypothetical protein [Phycisphaerales bacterium]